MSAPSRSYGPSWGDVALAQGELQKRFGGFVVVHQALANPRYNPRILWWRVQWSPSLAHVYNYYTWAAAEEWPCRRFSTVPEMLLELIRELSDKLEHIEHLRAMRGLCPLRDSPPNGPANLFKSVT